MTKEAINTKNHAFFAVDLIADPDNQNNKELMAAVTGAIWKCATGNPDNIQRFEELELMELLIRLLRDNSDALDDLQFNPQKMGMLTNVVGAIAECTASQENIVSRVPVIIQAFSYQFPNCTTPRTLSNKKTAWPVS